MFSTNGFRKIFAVIFSVQFLFTFHTYAGELRGLNAIITGGLRGIGEACVVALAREGVNVGIAVNKSIDEAQKVVATVQQMGVDVCVFQCDVANPNDVKRMVDAVATR